MFRVSIMETVHNHAEDLSQNSLSDPDIWGRLIEYRKEVQWDNILGQVEKLESKFNSNSDVSKVWKRFVNEPVIDQYGQVWMVWENLSADPSSPRDRYQVYKISDDKDDFKYVFVDALEIVPMSNGANYQFSVGFDNFGDEEVLNIQMSDKINEYYCLISNHERELWEAYRRWMKHDNDSYSAMEDLRRSYERYEKMQRKLGNYSFSAEKRFWEIYEKYERIWQKLGSVSIRDLAIAA